MKFPSIFRLPSHQRFDIQPRYYDPIKEEIEEKRRKARRTIELRKKQGLPAQIKPGDRIEGAFLKRAPRQDNSTSIRLGLAAVLFGGTVAFLYFGNIAIYITLGIALFFLVMRKLRGQ